MFGSRRLDHPDNAQFPTSLLPELYAVSLEGGKRPKQFLTTPAIDVDIASDGNRLLYHDRKGYEDPFRKHHVSAIASDIWLLDKGTGDHTKLSTFAGEDRNPVWGNGDAYYFLSEKSGSFNIWRGSTADPSVQEQITEFDTHPIRHLSRANDGTLAFTFHGSIFTLKNGGDPELCDVRISVDHRGKGPVAFGLGDGIAEMALSPDEMEIAFVYRGEVFVTSVDHDSTKRITNTPEQERSVSYLSDGRTLVYASERDGSWGIYATSLVDENELRFSRSTLLQEQALVTTEADEFQPVPSPMDDAVAYLHNRNEIRVVDLESGKTRTVVAAKHNNSYQDGDILFNWSDDGRWIATQFLARGRWRTNIGLVPAKTGGTPVDISLTGYEELNPKWAMDGSAVLWTTRRYGERSHGSWGGEVDVMAAFLDRATYEKFTETKEDREYRKEQEENGSGRHGGIGNNASPRGQVSVHPHPTGLIADDESVVEWSGFEDRRLRLTMHSSDLADFALTEDGTSLYYLSRFENDYDLWRHDFLSGSTSFVKSIGAGDSDPIQLTLSEDGKTAYILANGAIYKLDLSNKEIAKVGNDGIILIDRHKERLHSFEHVARQVRQKFYKTDMHGVDWDFFVEAYRKKLPEIENSRDFAVLLSEMLGELNASHTGARFHSTDGNADSTSSLGAFYDDTFGRKGVKIKEVIEGGPLSRSDVAVPDGAIILAVNGQRLDREANIYALLNHQQNRIVRVTVADHAGALERDVFVRPISLSDEAELLYRRWVKKRRDIVQNASNGRLGYVHVRSMDDESYREAFSETFGRNIDKEGLVVDTRFNTGGWLHDDLIVMLNGRPYMYFVARGQELREEPEERWHKPSILVVSEGNYSDAHMFPYAYRHLGLGDIVGMPIPGTGTAVWWETLHTGDITFGIPQIGMRIDDGTYLENQQLEPDHLVNLDPKSAALGSDTQLLMAVTKLLQQLDN